MKRLQAELATLSQKGGNSVNLIIYSVQFGKELLTLLAVCLFCGCFIVFVCLSLWCWGLDVDLIVSVPDFSYLFL